MKKRRRKQKFDKQMQKKLLGVFAFVLLVLVILNLKMQQLHIMGIFIRYLIRQMAFSRNVGGFAKTGLTS